MKRGQNYPSFACAIMEQPSCMECGFKFPNPLEKKVKDKSLRHVCIDPKCEKFVLCHKCFKEHKHAD